VAVNIHSIRFLPEAEWRRQFVGFQACPQETGTRLFMDARLNKSVPVFFLSVFFLSVPVFFLQELGGWSDIRMVQRYAHLAPEHL